MRALFVLIILGVLLGGASTHARAQEIENPPSNPVPTTVSATIEQVTPNVDPRFAVTAVEREQSLFGRDPFLLQYEGATAFGNAAQVRQIGDRNLTVLGQYGRENVASIGILGDDNDVTVTQRGTGNRLGISIEGHQNVVPVTQIGTGNELSLELFGSGLALDQQGLFLGGGAPLNTRPGGIVQEGTGNIPLYIQVRRGN